ncbi:MAG: hypothetical protein QF785_10565, partial [Phycisphaeraceae bacterium]|nr:hypothetical protein [Phycisphaeraceae bacterium]
AQRPAGDVDHRNAGRDQRSIGERDFSGAVVHRFCQTCSSVPALTIDADNSPRHGVLWTRFDDGWLAPNLNDENVAVTGDGFETVAAARDVTWIDR